MATKKGGLGRGLDSLFADTTGGTSAPSTLPMAEIERDETQPRKTFDAQALSELAASIAEHGVLQPIVVRPTPTGTYYIIAGERRWRAARQAGLTEIPAIIKEVSTQEAAEIALIENLQREDLNPVEEAMGYRRLMEENSLTQEQAAQRVGKSRSGVANSLRLLALSESALRALEKGEITSGHAKALLAMQDHQEQDRLVELIIKNALNVRETERMVKTMKKGRGGSPASSKPALPTEVELALQNTLGLLVQVSYTGGKGKVSIPFYSDEELKALANMLGNIEIEKGE